MRKSWKLHELEQLKALYANESNSVADIARILNCTHSAAKNKIRVLKLKRRTQWGDREVEYLKVLATEYPKSVLIKKYNEWAKKNGFKVRHSSVLYYKLKNLRVSVKVQASSEWFRSEEIAAFLGAKHDSISHWFGTYKNDLKPIPAADSGRVLVVNRKRLRDLFLKYPHILDKYRLTVDLPWFMRLFKD